METGMGASVALLSSVGIGVTNLIATLIGMFLIAAGWIFFQSTLPKSDPIDLNELSINSLQKQFDAFLKQYWTFDKKN